MVLYIKRYERNATRRWTAVIQITSGRALLIRMDFSGDVQIVCGAPNFARQAEVNECRSW